MNIGNTISTLLFLAIGTLYACKKQDAQDSNHSSQFHIFSPAEGQAFNEYDTVWVKYNISSVDDLHEYQIVINNISESKNVLTYDGHSHDKTASGELYFIPEVSADAMMELNIITLDHNSNRSEKKVAFLIKNITDTIAPVITLLSPNTAMYNNGSSVSIKGHIDHVVPLNNARISMTRNGISVFDFEPSVKGKKSYAFDTIYPISITEQANFSLVVSASDENKRTGARRFDFHVHP